MVLPYSTFGAKTPQRLAYLFVWPWEIFTQLNSRHKLYVQHNNNKYRPPQFPLLTYNKDFFLPQHTIQVDTDMTLKSSACSAPSLDWELPGFWPAYDPSS